MIETLLDSLSYPFIQHAIIAGILVSIITAIIGTLIVVNRMVFLAAGIAHSAYGGIGIAIYFGIPVLLSTTLFTVIMTLIIAYLSYVHKDRIDTLIGLIWALGMSIGIVFVDMTPGYQAGFMSWLFGSILAVNDQDIYFMCVLLLLIIAIVVKFYRTILSISYDKEYAKIKGINVGAFHTLILLLCALSTVIAIKVVGIILVIALLSIPIYIAEKLSSSLAIMMVIATLLSSAFTLTGLVISYIYNISSGATIILVSAATMFFLLLYQMIRDHLRRLS